MEDHRSCTYPCFWPFKTFYFFPNMCFVIAVSSLLYFSKRKGQWEIELRKWRSYFILVQTPVIRDKRRRCVMGCWKKKKILLELHKIRKGPFEIWDTAWNVWVIKFSANSNIQPTVWCSHLKAGLRLTVFLTAW